MTRGRLMLALLAFAQFMLIVDITVVQVALPSIGVDLALGREALTWVVTTYTLVFGGLMILGGRLADVLGARRTLLVGLTVFTAASLVCGLATSGGVLIGARAAQGVGAALLSPAALAIITTSFRGNDRSRALGVWAAIGGAGAAAGVLLSGLLTAGPGWQWVFWVNVPVGVVVLALIPGLVRPDGTVGARQPVDVPGALAVTAATALLIYGVVHAGEAGWAAPVTVGALLAAVIGYAVFGGIESRVATPLMRPQTLARRPVVSGTLLMLVATGLMLGLFFLTSLYLQHVRGLDALATGLLFLPVALAITAGAQLGAHLVGRVGGRAVAVGGLLLTALGAAVLTQAPAVDGVIAAVLPGFVLAAFGIGPVFVAATTTTLANVPPDEAGVASGVVNTFHELGGSIGVALVSTVAAVSISGSGTSGFTSGYVVCSVVAAVAGVVALGLVPGGKPHAVAGHGHGVAQGH
ncbi:EmrB/QacA subfamily drug resistance transporter [Pseudonocardia hierapolitana]|uniref:EmrB/QacA subfamily drug resistance transporter n=1 Tax=Pseudonocardia hierapolitana TaxID=1128676 RepID=A0A561SWJ8_9PSEU|nr:MFS transporter [Pseudonocardia hierapolitana]TWF79239.1 EmrB/QacA subfamily drug resistance transporter [Pseudonocardia hierapolitana]